MGIWCLRLHILSYPISGENETYHQGPASTLAVVEALQHATETLVSASAVVASLQLATEMPARKIAAVPSLQHTIDPGVMNGRLFRPSDLEKQMATTICPLPTLESPNLG